MRYEPAPTAHTALDGSVLHYLDRRSNFADREQPGTVRPRLVADQLDGLGDRPGDSNPLRHVARYYPRAAGWSLRRPQRSAHHYDRLRCDQRVSGSMPG